MRVALVGSPSDRARLRSQLRDLVEIAGEFASLGAAHASEVDADAFVVATERPDDHRDDDETLVEPLTAREVQVLELLAEGLSNKGIADRLRISDQTVKFHVASISGKLGASNRTAAVRRGVRLGLITL